MTTRKTKQITNIKAHINHYLIEQKGNCDCFYIGRKVEILKIRQGKTLIRIAFTKISENIILLLDAIEKPDFYEKAKKLKVDKHIQRFLNRSEKYMDDYLINEFSIDFASIYK
jgi:hypothetical protein